MCILSLNKSIGREPMILETNRCKIIKLQKNDYENVRELYFDEDVRRFLGGVCSTERFDENFNDMVFSEDGSFYWIVRLKESNEFIGLVSLDKHHEGLDTEISYQFKAIWWGRGYAEEVIRRIIDYAFYELKLRKLVAETQSANKASCKLLKKAGMNLEQIVTRFDAEQSIFSISR